MSHKRCRASAATSWSSRNSPAVAGTVATMRSATLPRRREPCRPDPPRGRAVPVSAQVCANAPRCPRPPVRAPRRRCRARARVLVPGIPTHIRPTHRPVTNADRAVDREHLAMVAARATPSGAVETRRVVAAHLDAARAQAIPEARAKRCRSRPASRRCRRTRTPACALAISASANLVPVVVVVDDIVLEMDVVPAPRRSRRARPDSSRARLSAAGRCCLRSAARPPRARTPGRQAREPGRARCVRPAGCAVVVSSGEHDPV